MFQQYKPKYNSAISVILNALYALIIKAMKSRFGSFSFGFAWVFLEPLLHLAIIITIFGVIFGRFDGEFFTIETLLFTILNWFLIRDIITNNLNTISSNKNYLVYPTLKPIIFYVSGYISVSIISFLLQLVFFVVCLIFLESFIFENAWKLIFIFILSGMFGLSISVILASVTINSPGLQRIFMLSLRFLYIGSLVIFPIDIIPIEYIDLVFLNPLAQMMELTREIIFPIRNYNISITYIVIWLTVLLLSSIFIYEAIGKTID
tara:strand:- start:5322 stop:6110 length:789 start_codon:yes stop_codon:yes gene_type:complete